MHHVLNPYEAFVQQQQLQPHGYHQKIEETAPKDPQDY